MVDYLKFNVGIFSGCITVPATAFAASTGTTTIRTATTRATTATAARTTTTPTATTTTKIIAEPLFTRVSTE